MRCPKCLKKMVIVREDTSYNDHPKKRYSRTIFHCKTDDIWVRLEVPRESGNGQKSQKN